MTHSHRHIRRGRYCHDHRVSHKDPSTDRTVRYGSFSVRGPRLFNTLPSELRNMTNCSSESFKKALDKFLKTIPDEPQTHAYTYIRRAEYNSLLYRFHLPLSDIPQYRKSLTICHKVGTEPGSHRHVSTSKYQTSIIFITIAACAIQEHWHSFSNIVFIIGGRISIYYPGLLVTTV